MKKMILLALAAGISGCLFENSDMDKENVSIKEFNSTKNIIRVNGKSIAGEIKILDTGLLIDETRDNILWIKGELLIANIKSEAEKNNIDGGGLQIFNMEAKDIKELIPHPIDSLCLDDNGIIKITSKIKDKNNPDKKDKSLMRFIESKNSVLNNIRVEEYFFNPLIPLESSSDKNVDKIIKSNTNGCNQSYVFNKNKELDDEKTELVSFVEQVHPYTSVKVYQDNSPKQKIINSMKFKEKDFPRTRIHYMHTTEEMIVEEKLYKMNIGSDYHVDTEDTENFNTIEGEIRGNSITMAFKAVDNIEIINITKTINGLKPMSIEKINIEEEKKKLLKNSEIKRINKIRNGYIFTVKQEDGMDILITYNKKDGFKYVLKGVNLSQDIKVSNNMCYIALGHNFSKGESKTVKILDVCNT